MNSFNEHVIKLVQNTVREYSPTEDVNFDKICSRLGLDVIKGVFKARQDGMQTGKTIIINSHIKSEERLRFTQFHELTHYLLEKDGYLISELHDLNFHNKDEFDRQLEIYCNIGAAEFLMPRERFRKLYEEKGFNVELIPYAATQFNSSTIATTIQLAQVAPKKCITAICEFTQDKTTPLQSEIFNQKNRSPNRKLHVIYSASSPTVRYKLAKNTVIPDDHLIHDAFLQDHSIEEKSYVPFRSGKKMPCYCEALGKKNRVYTIFHLNTPWTSTNEMQMNLL